MGGPPIDPHTKQTCSEASGCYGQKMEMRHKWQMLFWKLPSLQFISLPQWGKWAPGGRNREFCAAGSGLKATRLVPVVTHFHQCQTSTKVGHRTNVGFSGRGEGAKTSLTPLWKRTSTKMVINSRRLFLVARKTGHLFAGPRQYWLDRG